MSKKSYTVGRPNWRGYQLKASHLRVYMKKRGYTLDGYILVHHIKNMLAEIIVKYSVLVDPETVEIVCHGFN